MFAGYETLNGVEAGTTLLALMVAMKLLETRSARDQLVLLLTAYFLVLAAFLYGQQLWLLPIAVGVVWLITATLLRVAHIHAPLQPGAIVGLSGKMLVQALPITLVLFLLFPRVPGPFWALPTPTHATTGLGRQDVARRYHGAELSSDVGISGPVRRRGTATRATLLAGSGAARFRRLHLERGRASRLRRDTRVRGCPVRLHA